MESKRNKQLFNNDLQPSLWLLAYGIKAMNPLAKIPTEYEVATQTVDPKHLESLLKEYDKFRASIIQSYSTIVKSEDNNTIKIVHRLFEAALKGTDIYKENAEILVNARQINQESLLQEEILGIPNETLERIFPKTVDAFVYMINANEEMKNNTKYEINHALQEIKFEEQRKILAQKQEEIKKLKESAQVILDKYKLIDEMNKYKKTDENTDYDVYKKQIDQEFNEIPFVMDLNSALTDIEGEYRRLYDKYLIVNSLKDNEDEYATRLENAPSYETLKENRKFNTDNNPRFEILEKTISDMKSELVGLNSTMQRQYLTSTVNHRVDTYVGFFQGSVAFQNNIGVEQYKKDVVALKNDYDEIKRLTALVNLDDVNKMNLEKLVRNFDSNPNPAILKDAMKIVEDENICEKNYLQNKTKFDANVNNAQANVVKIINDNIMKNDEASPPLKRFFGRLLSVLWGLVPVIGQGTMFYRLFTRPHGGWLILDSKTQEAGQRAIDKITKKT